MVVHFGFDGLYFAPAVRVGGAFPVTYISETPAEWAVLLGSSVILLWAAARALRLVRAAVLPYDDRQGCR